jgi:glycosyltransferase involved in cell wall biosynthesis
MALLRLLADMDRKVFDAQVVCMIPIGPVGKRIQALGIPVISLDMNPGYPTVGGFLKLLGILKKFRPNIFQTWLYHADLLGLVAAKLLGIKNIIWNIRSTHMEFEQYGWISGLVFKICALFSSWPKAVVVNSQMGQLVHTKSGYHPKEWICIPNGINTDQFRPDTKARMSVRQEWDVANNEFLAGMIGRFDPMKAHPVFLKAAAIVQANYPNTCFVCIGEGPASYFTEMKKLASQLKLFNVLWPGLRTDMPAVYNALDLLVSSSLFGEGFPNVVAEAMACGKPCVVTDVGDANMLVANSGICVHPGRPEDLAQAIEQMLGKSATERAKLGEKARQRIIENYNMEKMSQAYSALYKRLA